MNGFLLPYELNDSELDDYWRPQVDNCNVCMVNYTFVGKVNTFDNDIALLMGQLGQHLSVQHHDFFLALHIIYIFIQLALTSINYSGERA